VGGIAASDRWRAQPSPLAYRSQPNTVLLVTHEMIVVDLNDKISLDEFRSDCFFDCTGLQVEIR